MPSSRARPRATSMSSARERGDMPAVGSSMSSSRGCAGQRQRELHALGVAVGQRGAMRVGKVRAAHALEDGVGGLVRDGARERGEVAACVPRGRGGRPPRSRAPSSRRRSPPPGTCVPRRGARSHAAAARRCGCSRRRTVPASGTSCPLTRLKHVDLPAPLGPMSATSSPACTVNETSSTARMPPKAWARCSTTSTGAPGAAASPAMRVAVMTVLLRRAPTSACVRSAPPRRRSRPERAAPARGSTHPAARASIRVTRGSQSASHVNAAAPMSGPKIVLSPPSSTITSASTERGIASDLRRDAALGERVDSRRRARRRSPRSRSRAIAWRARRCRARSRAAASRARRAAQSRRASARCAPAPRARSPTTASVNT